MSRGLLAAEVEERIAVVGRLTARWESCVRRRRLPLLLLLGVDEQHPRASYTSQSASSLQTQEQDGEYQEGPKFMAFVDMVAVQENKLLGCEIADGDDGAVKFLTLLKICSENIAR